jgi:hypothetical protein
MAAPDPDPRDRRARLHDLGTLNGIDFIEIADTAQTRLRVHFIEATPDAAALGAAITSATITGGETIPTVAVNPAATWHWDTDAHGRPVVELSVDAPGDFSTYTFALVTGAPVLDRVYDHVPFTFKAGCPSTIDCEPPAVVAELGASAAPPIDYLAKDFDSFRRVLSDFSAVRYPAWQERSRADFGVMFMEALSAVADELSYQQDRVAAEAWLETATQRRSLVRLARLVDYEPGVATASATTLQFQMLADGAIPRGIVVGSLTPDGSLVEFETGTGLRDDRLYDARVAWNELRAHWFDDAQRCVPAGATDLYVVRPGTPLARGQQVLVEQASPAGEPPKRAIVELAADPVDSVDPLFGPPGGTPLTHLVWRPQDALPFALDLALTTMHGNLVPATQGRTHTERFVTSSDWSPLPGPARAVVRTGPGGALLFLHTLTSSPLAWLDHGVAGDGAWPEITVAEASTGPWSYRRTLIAAKPDEPVFTLDPMRYLPLGGELGASEYDSDDGDTMRFGDGERGAVPRDGASFEVTYRVGGGLRGNVAAGALTRIDPATAAALGIAGVSNPRPASGGRDEEPDEQVRELAPQAFRATQYRAVRAEDYDRAAARELAWVRRAGTRFRYTGSWLTVFTAVDISGGESLSPEAAVDLARLLDRYRLAGYEAFGLGPRYASLDVIVAVCALPEAFRGDVQASVLAALRAFFDPDRFTFGQPLERSVLEAAVQDVPGVDGVTAVRYRRRGHTAGFVPMGDTVEVAADEIVRADNDANRPDAGSFRVDVGGGK